MTDYKRDSKGRFIKGTPQPCGFGKGKQTVPWNKGTHIQTNTGRTHFGSEDCGFVQGFGEDNSNFIHGKRSRGSINFYPPEFYKMRELILLRDNYICKMCDREGNIVHHIDINKDNNSKSNLITLCKSCHSTIHGKNVEKEFIPIIRRLLNND